MMACITYLFGEAVKIENKLTAQKNGAEISAPFVEKLFN
jgi:hypothetical protein